MEENATKMVSGALLGIDGETIIVNSKAYFISPPTIKKLVGSGYYLSELEKDGGELVSHLQEMENATKALSWFIRGDETLSEELSKGTLTEIVEGLETAMRLIDVRNFTRLSTLARNVGMLIAKQR